MATDPEFIDEWRRFTEEVRKHWLARSRSSKAEKELMIRTNLSLGDLLNDPDFPQDIKQTILKKAKVLLNIDDIVDNPSLARTLAGGAVGSVTRLTDKDILQFVPGNLPEGSAKKQLLSGLSLSIDQSKAKIAEGEGSMIRLSANLPSVEWLEQVMGSQDALKGLSAGQKVLIFDTETAGLSTKLAGVHDVGYSVMSVGEDGKLGAKLADGVSASFSVPRLEYGKIHTPAGFQSINEFLQRPGLAGAGTGDEFIASIYPMLKEMQSADFIAGQNVRFDIGQVIQNAMRTEAYQQGTMDIEGDNIKALIDDIWDNKIASPGNVIDTRELLNTYKAFDQTGLSVAPELLLRGENRPRSLENIVLSTNLVDLMEQEGVNVEEFFLKGTKQHSAAFDNQLTGYLLKFMQEERLKASPTGGIGLGQGATALARRIRFRTLSSYAYTPVSNIGDISDIDPKLFARMLEQNQIAIGVMGDSTAYSVDKFFDTKTTDADTIYKHLADDTNPLFMVGKVTPMEQGVWASRQVSANILKNAGAPSATIDQVITRGNMWQFLSGMAQPGTGMLSASSQLLKQGGVLTDAEFETVQKAWAKVGMPFAGISREERILTGALAHASTLDSEVLNLIKANPSENFLASTLPDLGLRFAEQVKADVGGSGKISMPLDILAAAAESDSRLAALKFGDVAEEGNVKFLNFSVTDQPVTEGSGKLFNVGVTIDKKQAEALSEWLRNAADDTMIGDRTLASFGLDASMRATIMDEIMETGPKWGINVGFLDNSAADYAANAVNDLLQSLVRDTDRVGFALPFLGREGGILKAGAAVLNRFLSDDDIAAIDADLQRTLKLSGDLQEEVVGNPKVARAIKEYQDRVTAQVEEQMRTVSEADDGVINFASTSEKSTKPAPDVGASATKAAGAADETAGEEAVKIVGDRTQTVLDATQSAWDNSTKFVDAYVNLTTKKLPFVGAALAGLFIGAAIWKKDKEEDYYGEPLEISGFEPQPMNNSPAAAEVAMGIDQYGPGLPPQRRDYLATAGVGFNQYNNRINHTSMGTNKYDRLYGA